MYEVRWKRGARGINVVTHHIFCCHSWTKKCGHRTITINSIYWYLGTDVARNLTKAPLIQLFCLEPQSHDYYLTTNKHKYCYKLWILSIIIKLKHCLLCIYYLLKNYLIFVCNFLLLLKIECITDTWICIRNHSGRILWALIWIFNNCR